MNANFTFPPPKPVMPRPPSAYRPKAKAPSRSSNALRASVLEAALELGVGTNPLVSDWMFSNSLKEEDEEVCALYWLWPRNFVLAVSFFLPARLGSSERDNFACRSQAHRMIRALDVARGCPTHILLSCQHTLGIPFASRLPKPMRT
ncbi:hypothetical protein NLJ89_g9824 [Agrocybe chaxingu]|uniref:Uncharacterized protein n=1 Tax=Agrocybe chaxingu TaxID=84603 RepID=A0A9W8JSB2_9AGAR|nr:hypothetical protein NLJ89_g9824 [Agrocybe chaxingu]